MRQQVFSPKKMGVSNTCSIQVLKRDNYMCKMTGVVKWGSSPDKFPSGMVYAQDNVGAAHIMPWSAGTLVSCFVERHRWVSHVLQF